MEKGLSWTPSILLNNSNFTRARGLVKISAILSQVLQYSTMISFDCSFSLTKWNWVSICLVFLWNTGLYASLMVLWLSVLMEVEFFCSSPASLRSLLNHITSHVAAHNAWYSDSHEDKATLICFFFSAPRYDPGSYAECVTCDRPLIIQVTFPV